MLNTAVIEGRLCTDPKFTEGSEPKRDRAWFRIANDEDYKDTNGESPTSFFNVVCWNGTARAVAEWCKKGKFVTIEGRWQQRNVGTEDDPKDYVEIKASRIRFGPDAKSQGANELVKKVLEELKKEQERSTQENTTGTETTNSSAPF